MLEGSTVAIVGAGGIGRELIAMLEPHDVEIIAVTRSGRDGTLPVERIGEVWGEADHFVIARPPPTARATSWAPTSSRRCSRTPGS